MITHLKGSIESVYENTAVLDVGGVGYKLICSSKTLSEIQNYKGIVKLFTVMSIREDSWILYGFISERERNWFNILVSVQGVGGKVAIAILSALNDDEIYNAFVMSDKNMLTRADGVGPKLAARIISELKEKVVGKIEISQCAHNESKKTTSTTNDVASALLNLGYQKSDILRAMSLVEQCENYEFDKLLKQVLSKLSSGV